MVALTGVIIPFTLGIWDKEENQDELQQIAGQYAFDLASWEVQALSSLAREIFYGENKASQQTTLRSQIGAVLADNGISAFPPLIFRLEKPPHLLVVSSRERIAYLHRKVLRQVLSTSEMEQLETQVDKLGLSSLVVELGGFGATYPTIVGDHLSTTDTINAVVEEWLHQYLAFKPLGFLYVLDSLGIRSDFDIVTMNETLAGMVSKEIGSAVYARYYESQDKAKADQNAAGFDFDAEMRNTRRTVDEYLSQGKIEEAERYMEVRRKEFVAHGYHIRKLNQAYFAFHGIYAQDPASVSPISEDLKQLRVKNPSLKQFLNKVAMMSSYEKLTGALTE